MCSHNSKWISQELREGIYLHLCTSKHKEVKYVVIVCLDTSCFRTCPRGLWPCLYHWFFSAAKIKIITWPQCNLSQSLYRNSQHDITTLRKLTNNCMCVQSQQAKFMLSANQNSKQKHTPYMLSKVTQKPTSSEDNMSQVRCQNVTCAMGGEIDTK